jgi:hypothetical protein
MLALLLVGTEVGSLVLLVALDEESVLVEVWLLDDVTEDMVVFAVPECDALVDVAVPVLLESEGEESTVDEVERANWPE